MAEFIFKNMVAKRGLDKEFYIRSAATSSEEIGNGIYPPAAYELGRNNIPIDKEKRATRITRDDYLEYDMIIVMEQYNIRNLRDIAGFDPENKIWKLLDFNFKNLHNSVLLCYLCAFALPEVVLGHNRLSAVRHVVVILVVADAQEGTADVISIATNVSSSVKGESLKDTARNIEALMADMIIVEHTIPKVI